MARFQYKSIFQEESWTKVFDNAEGKDEEFYNLVIQEFEKSNYPNLEIGKEEIAMDLTFFESNARKREMVVVQSTDNMFGNYRVYYSAHISGNVAQFARYECMEARGLLNILTGATGANMRSQLRAQCTSLLEWEAFIMLDNLSDIIYRSVMRKIDDKFEENKRLLSLK